MTRIGIPGKRQRHKVELTDPDWSLGKLGGFAVFHKVFPEADRNECFHVIVIPHVLVRRNANVRLASCDRWLKPTDVIAPGILSQGPPPSTARVVELL